MGKKRKMWNSIPLCIFLFIGCGVGIMVFICNEMTSLISFLEWNASN